jgi:hypothetical protein
MANATFDPIYVTGSTWGSQQSPIMVEPGTVNNLFTVYLTNSVTYSLQSITVTLSLSYPFSSSTNLGIPSVISLLPSGATATSVFYLNIAANCPEGVYTLPLQISFVSVGNVYTTYTSVQLPVLGSSSVGIQSYSLQQTNMFPGDNNVGILIYLVNSGNLPVNNVSAKLSTPPPLSPAYPSSNEATIGTMPLLQPQLIKFFFNVPSSISSPRNLEFQLNISYNGQNYTYGIPLSISSVANFTESANKLPALKQGSSSVNVPLSITNTGNTTAKSVQAQLLLPNELSGTTFTFLGDMTPGTSNLATFALDVSSNAPPGTYYGTLKITWIQDNAPGRQFSQDIPVAFQIHPNLYNELVNDLSGVALYVAIIVIIVVAIIVILLRRRK